MIARKRFFLTFHPYSQGIDLPMSADEATIQSLRRDIALQVSKIARRSGDTQVAVARRLGIPQPTLSKINNGRVHDLSIELLLRVAIRAGLALTLQTGLDATEAGAFVLGLVRGSAPMQMDPDLRSKPANRCRLPAKI